MFEVISPNDELLRQYISYIYKFSVEGKGFQRKLVIFPNIGSAITIYKDVEFIEEGYQRFSSVEKKGESDVVLHLNRVDPITVHEIGEQKRIGIVFKPIGINQFIQETPGELLERNNPSLIRVPGNFIQFSTKIDIDGSLAYNSALIEDLLLSIYKPFTNALLERCVKEITDTSELTKIDDLAERVGASSKTINRLFHKYIGLSPVEFRKIAQFREALTTKIKNKDASIADVALENNYYDLPYMIKVFREFTGINATEFFQNVSTSAEGKYVYMAM